MNDNSKSSIRRFSIEQKRMSDKLRNAEVGLKGAYNTLEDINRAYRHQENLIAIKNCLLSKNKS